MSPCSVPSPARRVRSFRTYGARASPSATWSTSPGALRTAGEFVQFAVSLGDETVLLDLARDWRQKAPTRLDIGPVLDIQDAVGSKVTALVGRGLPRDFIDVAAALQRYSREELMTFAFVRDPGLRVLDFILAAHALDAVPAAAFAAYELNTSAVNDVRARFASWPRDESSDEAGRRAYGATRPSQSPPRISNFKLMFWLGSPSLSPHHSGFPVRRDRAPPRLSATTSVVQRA